MSDLTVEIVKKVMPGRLRGAITQELVDKINTISTDPILTDEIKKNFLGYTYHLVVFQYNQGNSF